jgi:hypothetical protein
MSLVLTSVHKHSKEGRGKGRHCVVVVLDSRMKEVVRSLPGLAGGWGRSALAMFGEKYAGLHE